MNLKDDFYSIIWFDILENYSNYSIKLNPQHLIYSGHFPGYPVTPAVIQMQILHELLETSLNTKLSLVDMSQAKFLKVINPLKNDTLEIHIENHVVDSKINVFSIGKYNADIFFKIKARYTS